MRSAYSFRRSLMAVVIGGMVFGAGNVSAASLVEAIEKAVQTNPVMEESKANRRAQEYELKQQRGLYLPSLDLTAATGPEWTKNQSRSEGSSMPRHQAQITLSQLLFDGFNREGGVDRQAARVDAAALRVLERTESMAVDVAEAYLDVLRNQDLLTLAIENVDTHRSTLNKVRQRVTGGQTGTGDLQQAISRLAASRDTQIQVERDLMDAQIRYLRLVDDDPKDLSRPARQNLPGTMEMGVRYALMNNPSVNAAAAELDEANALHRQAGSGFYPRFRAEVSGAKNRNLDGVRGQADEGTALLRMDWNLFRGGIDRNLRMETAERIGENRARVMRFERAIAQEVRLSWNAMQAANKRSEALNEEVLANSQVVTAYRQEFELGQRDLLDLLDADNELFAARSRLATAEYTEEFAIFRTLAAMGTLLPTLGIQVPEEAKAEARAGAGVTSERTEPFIARSGEVPEAQPAALQVTH